ncbi:hypothetical protein D3C75_1278810 [compost metagenome]
MAKALHQLHLRHAALNGIDMSIPMRAEDFVEISDFNAVKLLVSHVPPPGVSEVFARMLG